MSLVELVEALVRDIDLTTKDKSDANEKAEKLAEKYKDVKPQSYPMPMERFHGLPAFQNEKEISN
jgi:hypothetical protein